MAEKRQFAKSAWIAAVEVIQKSDNALRQIARYGDLGWAQS